MKQILILVFFVIFTACKNDATLENKIKEDVTYLADDALEGRQTGTKGEILAAEYLAKRFEEIGAVGKGTDNYFQEFTFKPNNDPHKETEFVSEIKDSTITGRNVIGYINHNASQTIVIGAHYDHLGYGDYGSLHRGERAIHNGADDNASGVAVMLELARKLKNSNTNNNYLFIAFSGEELGLLGSNYFVKNPTVSLSDVNLMINMDMIGRLKEDKSLAVYGVGTSPALKQAIYDSNEDGFKLIENESGVGPSDQTSFYLNDIPVLHFFTGQHEDYHKPQDDADKLNYEGMDLIADYIFGIISDLNDDGKLAFVKTKDKSSDTPRFKVGLGVIPDYLYDGKGMRIDGISSDRPAEKAGLQKGDIVVKIGDSTVVDIYAYMRALSVFDKGDKTMIVVERDGKEVEADIQF